MNVSPKKAPSLTRQLQLRLALVTGVLLLALIARFITNFYLMNSNQYLRVEIVLLHNDANLLLSAMINQETGLRGYIATSNPIFLEPFQQGRLQYLSTISSLNTLLQDDEFRDAQKAFSQVKERSDLWYNTFALVQIQEVKAGNLAVARQVSVAEKGKSLFDQLRTSITQLQQLILKDLTRFSNEQDRIGWEILIGILLFSLFGIILLWYTFVFYRRDLMHQLNILTNAVQRIRNGDHLTRIHTLKHEELHLVGQTLNDLVDTLRLQQEAIADHTRQLEQANGEFRALFNAVNSAIIFVSPDGYILTVNRCFTEFFHLKAEEVVEFKYEVLQHYWQSCFSEPAIMQEYLSYSQTDEIHIYTTILKPSASETRDLELESLPVYSTGAKYVGRLYLLCDVTQEYALNRAKSDFVATVSHEFRTALTGIQGFSELIYSQECDTEQVIDFAQDIHADAGRLTRMINDLLDLERMQSGNVTIQRTPLHINTLLKDVVERMQITNPHHRILLDLDETLPKDAFDADKLTQVVMNLLSNAVKYSPQSEEILVKSRKENNIVHLSVQDHGIGISQENLERIFLPYSRIHSNITRYIEGTGLGLPIVHQIVQQHDGYVWVESTLGSGSTFHVLLPLSPVHEAAPVESRVS